MNTKEKKEKNANTLVANFLFLRSLRVFLSREEPVGSDWIEDSCSLAVSEISSTYSIEARHQQREKDKKEKERKRNLSCEDTIVQRHPSCFDCLSHSYFSRITKQGLIEQTRKE